MEENPASALPPPSTTAVAPGLPTAAPPLQRHRRRRPGCGWLGAALFFLLALGAWWYYRRVHARPAAAPHVVAIPVTVAMAKRGSVSVYLESIGTVTPVYTDAVTAQVTGVVTAVHYHEGQAVAAGDPLVDIDPQSYAAQLEEAEGTLARDQGLLAEARMDLQRYQQAWAANAIPRQQLEDQEKVVAQDIGVVNNDQGAVHYAQVQLGYTHITAPISGRAGLRLVDPGNLITGGGAVTLVVLTQVNPITVIFTLPENSLGSVAAQMQAGATLPVEAWDEAQQHLIASGDLQSMDNQVDTTTATVKLRAGFDNARQQLFPNQFVNTRLKLKTLTNQTLVPDSAVQHNGEAAFVYLIQNQKAALRPVTAGVSDNGQTAVTGIQPGDVVANSGFDKLENGAAVKPTTQPLPGSQNLPSLVP